MAAAFAVAATAVKGQSVETAIQKLAEARPTANNLFWALDRMKLVIDEYDKLQNTNRPSENMPGDLSDALIREALDIFEEDRSACKRIGRNAQPLISSTARILTVCNAGFLATAGDGTALSAIYRAFEDGKQIHVYVPETRPLFQGARLTAWELKQAGIPFTLVVDSAASGLVRDGKVDVCIIGADRIVSNGDAANKIGSYQLALACKQHKIPFFVAAPWSTIDTDRHDGRSITIEQRSPAEVYEYGSLYEIIPPDIDISNPAFDLIPAEFISGIITEKTVHYPPYRFTNKQE